MRTHRLAFLFLVLAVSVMVAWAVDVTGQWKAEFTTPDGSTRTSTFNLKQSGETVTGTIGGPRGDTEIKEGKVSGDSITMIVIRNFGGEERKMIYKGTVSGNEMKLKVTFEGADFEFDMTAKKAS